jgi:hypothetical protein
LPVCEDIHQNPRERPEKPPAGNLRFPRISGLASQSRAASLPAYRSGFDHRVKQQQPQKTNIMKIAKLAIAAAAVSLLAASCCPSTAPAPAPAPVQSSK